jgi:UDP-2,3-diacylglucosamine hydrolase
MPTLILSDIHLGETVADQQQAQAVLACIRRYQQLAAPEKLTLYLLGDILNVYWGEGTPLAQAFFWQAIKDMDVTCYFMAGNRDFLIKQQALAAYNIQLLTDPFVIEHRVPTINSSRPIKILLSHGDQWVKNDFFYRCFRYVTRLRWVQGLFLSLPNAWRANFASYLRRQSQDSHIKLSAKTQNQKSLKYIKAINIDTKVDINFDMSRYLPSRQIYGEIDIAYLKKKYHVDVIIHGHTHQPKNSRYQLDHQRSLYYYVTSDWHDGRGYVIYIDQHISLTRFDNL